MPPSKAYIDHQDRYSTNEVTIYWSFLWVDFNGQISMQGCL